MAQDVHFDCSTVVELWSVAQRAYCCAQEAKGCSDAQAPSYDCLADRGAAWSMARRKWCCQVKDVGCGAVALKFDCGKGIRDWRTARLLDNLRGFEAWSYQKQHFCGEP